MSSQRNTSLYSGQLSLISRAKNLSQSQLEVQSLLEGQYLQLIETEALVTTGRVVTNIWYVQYV